MKGSWKSSAAAAFHLDRVLFSSIHYPVDYGFIPGSMMPDGDPLDIMIIVEEPTFPGCREKARVIGVMRMEDEGGVDDKLLAVSAVDARFCGINDLPDLQPHWLHEIENFFRTYKTLENKKIIVPGWGDLKQAMPLLIPSNQSQPNCSDV